MCPPLTLADLMAAGVVLNIKPVCGRFPRVHATSDPIFFDLTSKLFREGLHEIDSVDPPVVAYLLMNDDVVEVIVVQRT